MKKTSYIKKTLGFLVIIAFFTSCDQILTPTQNAIDGSWNCVEQHEEDGQSNYTVQIDYDQSDSTIIYISNFLNLETNPNIPVEVRARVSGSSITIPQQTVGGHTVVGNGTIQLGFSKINLQFTDDLYGGSPWQVTATLTKL